MDVNTISVFGLGKLGAPIAACMAAKGLQVIGIDVDPEKVAAVNRGAAPVFEPGLEEMMARTEGRLTATENPREAISRSEATFIVVPTPSDPDGGFSVRYVLPACKAIGEALRDKEFHLVVLTSTVLPGTTGGQVLPALETASGKICSEDFGLCYSPEFIALGSVIRDFLQPDFLLIGESDTGSGERLEALYRRVTENGAPVARMNFVNAEIAKLAVNTFVTTKITFANTLARICEHVPGADVEAVTSALALDSRIGGRYLQGALGYGGPCFPRDNVALATFSRTVGVPPLLPEATHEANKTRAADVVYLVREHLPSGGTVGVLGLSYKPETEVVEESQGLAIATALAEAGVPVVAYDPAENARKQMAGVLETVDSLDECLAGADVIVLATPWEEFLSIDRDRFPSDGRRRVLIDCWRVLAPAALAPAVAYVPLGMGPEA
jgi:UDPglucose 6-dehydrogenase